MTPQHVNTAQNDNDTWAERGDYWQKKLNPVPQYKARKRRILHKPLVLSGHGIRLNVDRGTLLIKCGFTHYPQVREEHRFFPRDRQLPSRIVILDGDGSITFDALEWLSEHAAQTHPLKALTLLKEIVATGAIEYFVTMHREEIEKILQMGYSSTDANIKRAAGKVVPALGERGVRGYEKYL